MVSPSILNLWIGIRDPFDLVNSLESITSGATRGINNTGTVLLCGINPLFSNGSLVSGI